MNARVSVILPVYNEEESIGPVVEKVGAVMQASGREHEIIVVDDASTDGTPAILKGLPVRVITHDRNKGVGAARKTGIRAASGSVIVMMDTDSTYPAEKITELVSYIPEYDQVIGARTSEQGSSPFLRRLVKRLLFRFASYLAKENIPDLNSGMRAFKRENILPYLHLVPNGFSCVSTMTLVFLCNDYRVKYVPIEYYKRRGSSKFHIFIHTRDMLFTIIRMSVYFNPLRVFLPISALLFVAGFLKVVQEGGMPKESLLILLSGVMVFTFGLLADLLVTQEKGRIMNGTERAGGER